MVGLVLVSHSRALAEAVKRLVLSMTGNELPLAAVGGSGENHEDLGTDAIEILEAIQRVETGDGAIVLMDMGSAVLSAETALDLLDEAQRARIVLCSAPFVEGAVAAGVGVKLGNAADQIVREASVALQQKREHLHEETAPEVSIPTPTIEAGKGISIRVVVPNPVGLHARPAARFAQESAVFKADIFLRNLTNGKGPVSARSLTGLVTLEARKDNEIEITASGPEEQQALDRLKEFVESGMGDSLQETPVAAPDETPGKTIGISKGLAIGRLFFPGESTVTPPDNKIEDVPAETARLHEALKNTRVRLKQQTASVSRELGKTKGEIFAAQTFVLEDPVLIEKAERAIAQNHDNAAYAWLAAINEAVAAYQQLSDPILRQRAADLRDVGLAVAGELGLASSDSLAIPEPGLIVVRDLTPGQVTSLDDTKVRGVICLEGGKTSHSAILLRSRGIPTVAQAASIQTLLHAQSSSASTEIIAVINGETGEVILNPDKSTLEKIEAQQAEQKEHFQRQQKESAKPATTRDGRTIEVAANVGSLADAETAAANGADAIGLLRTEFLFMSRTEPPTEEEQVESLRAIVRAMHGKPVIIRTLDAGGDKELPYLHLPKEDNPFLGVRAIRLCLRQRALFQTQLRAILRAGVEGDVRVMFPMIATLDELAQAKAELEKARESLRTEKIEHSWPLSVGMMMEVPSAALLASQFAPQVDFFSIGTNDLTQYTLAVDRGNTTLQAMGDPLNPSVLFLIQQIAQAAQSRQIPVAVCGEAAADPKAAAVFLGLGVTELSVSPRTVPSTKQWVREQSLEELNALARR